MSNDRIFRTFITICGLAALSLGGCRGRDAVPDASAAEPAHVALLKDVEHSGPEALSLLGRPLMGPELGPTVAAERELELLQALSDYDSDPESEDAIIWVGRRLAYLGRFNEAIGVFTRGLAHHPQSYKLLRHRGHRHITL